MSKALPISALLEKLAESLSAADIIAAAQKASFAGQIVKWRTAHDMSQAELAELCDVTQSTVSKWENGDYNFTIEKMSEIAAALDMSLSISLVSGTVAEEPEDSISEGINNIIPFPTNGEMSLSADTSLRPDLQLVCSIESSEMLEEG